MQKARVLLTDCRLSFMGCVYLALYWEGYEVIGEMPGTEETLGCIETISPNAVILEASQEAVAGIEVIHRLKKNLPSLVVVLVVGNYDDEEEILAALKSGASACLSKSVTPRELLHTIDRAIRGEYPITQKIIEPSIASRIIGEFEASSISQEKPDSLPVRLSAFEQEILRYAADGNPAEEISGKLGATEDAIRQRLYVILGKLVANHRNHQPPQPLLS